MEDSNIKKTLISINVAKSSFENVDNNLNPIVPAIKIELMHLSNLLNELTE